MLLTYPWLDKLPRDFLWGNLDGSSKFHLVDCKKVCQPIKQGGLGIQNLIYFNCALLGKWLWRFATKRGEFWPNFIASKYGSSGGGWN